jgi:hypothetical protein
MAISIKGILVGLVCGFVVSLLGGMAMGAAMAVLYGPERVEELMGGSSGTLTMPLFFMDAISSIVAGYVAARVAGRGELINAVLCNMVGGGIGLLMALAMPPEAMTTSVIVLVTEPLFGLLGGYIRLRQVAEYA